MSWPRSRPSLAQECCALLGLENDAFRRAFSRLEHELLARDQNAAESKGDEGQTHDELAWALLILIRAHGDALQGEDLLELAGQDSRRALILARDALRLLHTSCSGFHWPTRRQAPATLVRLALELGFASTLFLSSSDEAKSEPSEGILTGRKGAHACIDGRTPIKQCSTLFAQHLRVLHGACAREGFLENAHALLVSWWKEELAYDEPTREVQDSLDDFFQLARACQASASTFEQATNRARALAPLMGQAIPYTRFLLQSTKASRSPRRLQEALWAANLFSSPESALLAPQAMRFAIKYEHAEVSDLALRLIANAKPSTNDTLFTSTIVMVSRQDAAWRRSALQKLRSSSRGMHSPVCSQSVLFARVVAALESSSTDDGISEVQLEIEI